MLQTGATWNFFQEGAGEGQEEVALPSKGVASSTPFSRCVASLHVSLNPFRPAVFCVPLDLGELSHSSEMEALIANTVIVKAFGGLSLCRTLGWPGGQ